jgi:hypothetical protein
MESAAPTSWKWTFSMGTWWTAASASPSFWKDGERVLRGARREGGLLDDLDDVREVPVSVLVLHRDVEFGGADAAALDLLEGDGGADFEGGDGAAIAVWSAPASASAPTSMSPLIPEKASR